MSVIKTRKFAIWLVGAATLFTSAYADQINGVGAIDVDNTLNVRQHPNADSRIVATLTSRDKVNIITKTGDWFRIDLNGQQAYVHSDYVVSSRRGEPVVQKEVTTTQTETGAASGQGVVDYAKSFLGVKYVYGGTSPSGFDCSGLVQYVYAHFNIKLNRVAADQTAHGKPVGRGNLAAGDLVFFHNTDRYSRINHVGIYVGGGSFIHAPQTGDVVKISSLDSGYYSNTFITARRIFE